MNLLSAFFVLQQPREAGPIISILNMKKIKSQVAQVSCPMPHDHSVVELGFEPKSIWLQNPCLFHGTKLYYYVYGLASTSATRCIAIQSQTTLPSLPVPRYSHVVTEWKVLTELSRFLAC